MSDDPTDILASARQRGSDSRQQAEGAEVIPARTSGHMAATS